MTSRLGRAAIAGLIVILLPLAGNADGAADARQRLATLLETYERHGTYSLPALSVEDLDVLLDGEFLVRGFHGRGHCGRALPLMRWASRQCAFSTGPACPSGLPPWESPANPIFA